MESVFFPTSFFDAQAVAPLTAEYKLLLGGAATHRRLLPCGVIFLPDYVFQSIGITSPAAGIHLADELQRRGIAVFDRDSRAFFNLYHFHWNLTGTQAGEGSAWDNAVTTSLAHVPPPLRSAVAQAMSIAPSKKISSPLCPTNLLSSLPAPGAGKKWVASELLVLLATYANPQQNDGGIFVVDFDALGAFCSLPAATVEQVLVTFNALNAVVFDPATREVFLPARMKNGKKKKVAFSAVDEARSRRVKHAARQMFTKTFGQTCEQFRAESKTSALKEKNVYKKKGNDSKQSEVSNAFARFMALYPPSRIGQVTKSMAVWNTISPSPDADKEVESAIIAGLTAWLRSDDWQKDGGKWILSMERFLAERRWTITLPLASHFGLNEDERWKGASSLIGKRVGDLIGKKSA